VIVFFKPKYCAMSHPFTTKKIQRSYCLNLKFRFCFRHKTKDQQLFLCQLLLLKVQRTLLCMLPCLLSNIKFDCLRHVMWRHVMWRYMLCEDCENICYVKTHCKDVKKYYAKTYYVKTCLTHVNTHYVNKHYVKTGYVKTGYVT